MRGFWKTGLLVLAGIGVLALLMSCNGDQPPPDPVPTTGEPTIDWRTENQVDLSWTDMPATVIGGSEALVFNRRILLELPVVREIVAIDTFMGFDRGDVIESEFAIYNDQDTALYNRSLHLEAGVDENYDAWDGRVLTGYPPTSLVFVDAVCRVNGRNAQDQLAARCHLLARITFKASGEPPPTGCDIAGPYDPRWNLLGQDRTTHQQLNAAKLAVGDRTGQPPLETLALLAQAVTDAGGCAAGPWDDEIAIKRSDGNVDGWHAVAFGTGGYTGTPGGDSWTLEAPRCGDPLPGDVGRLKLKVGGVKPKWTANLTYLFGPNAEFCREIGYTDGRVFCPARPDGHPEREACELYVGLPVWSHSLGTCFVRPNPFLYRCNPDAVGGTVTVTDPAANVITSLTYESSP